MGPSLKRRRTKAPPLESPAGLDAPSPDVEENASKAPSTSTTAAPIGNKSEDVASISKGTGLGTSSQEQSKPKSSWGTWPRKSIASTQLAKETILANKSSNKPSLETLDRLEPKKSPTAAVHRPPSMRLGKAKETLDITMGGTFEGNNLTSKGGPSTQPATGSTVEHSDVGVVGANSANELPKASVIDQPKEDHEAVAPQPTTSLSTSLTNNTVETVPGPKPSQGELSGRSSGWFGWFGRSDQQLSNQSPPSTTELDPKIPPIQESIKETESASNIQNSSNLVTEPASSTGNPSDKAIEPTLNTDNPSGLVVDPVVQKPASTSWFGLWSAAPPTAKTEATQDSLPTKLVEPEQDTVMEDAPPASPPAKANQPAAGSSWAFWSTESTKKAEPEKQEEPGQLAVVGEPSQVNPEPAKAATTKESKKSKSTKRSRPESTEIAAENTTPEPTSSKTVAQNTTPVKASPPNLLLPSVKSTYRLCENPSILRQIAQLLLLGKQQPVRHVFLTKDPPKIKKALAIGIHGLFPAPLLRTVIGQPTGTSIRFANHAAASIRRWADKNGSADCEIEKVALEGEGKIAERVDNLWKLLLNWIDHVRGADFILIACHSQGVPVAIMLVAKLIEFGVVSTSRIGVCAMAGVSLGPFPDYKSRLFSGSAGELFEFADPESTVSKRYEDSLRVALKYGVKVTYCGSIDDQLVSMESSVFACASHPHIYRGVFIDGRIHAPDFLSHLVGFALKLRNLGVSDHGLIRELSAPLAGSLYTGEGHSRLYDDGNVYDLAIEFALQTTSVGDVPLDLKKYEIPSNGNPYVLPWIMRGLLEEDFVKTELSQETTELLKQFDDWKPSTKVLKDVKYRLEAVRSKL